jgi:hypothetical protein
MADSHEFISCVLAEMKVDDVLSSRVFVDVTGEVVYTAKEDNDLLLLLQKKRNFPIVKVSLRCHADLNYNSKDYRG